MRREGSPRYPTRRSPRRFPSRACEVPPQTIQNGTAPDHGPGHKRSTHPDLKRPGSQPAGTPTTTMQWVAVFCRNTDSVVHVCSIFSEWVVISWGQQACAPHRERPDDRSAEHRRKSDDADNCLRELIELTASRGKAAAASHSRTASASSGFTQSASSARPRCNRLPERKSSHTQRIHEPRP